MSQYIKEELEEFVSQGAQIIASLVEAIEKNNFHLDAKLMNVAKNYVAEHTTNHGYVFKPYGEDLND